MAADQFVLIISGDAPLVEVVDGRDALRAALSREFFGPEGPQTDGHREEEAARWASFCDQESWEFSAGEPFAWEDRGEDYHVRVYLLTASEGRQKPSTAGRGR